MGGFVHSGKALTVHQMLRLDADSYPDIFTTEHGMPIADGTEPRILVTDSEIGDKSKGSTIGIGAAALQTAWFVLQYLDRWGSRQPRTQLEVMTLAYITISIIISFLWWNKPRDIQLAICLIHPTAFASHNDDVISILPAASASRNDDVISIHPAAPISPNDMIAATLTLRSSLQSSPVFNDIIQSVIKRIKTLFHSRNLQDAWSSLTRGVKSEPSAAAFLVFGMIFGGIHCLTWSSLFPTRPEAKLWKLCAVYCAVFNIAMLIIGVIRYAASQRTIQWIENIAAIIAVSLFIGYVVCRVILFVLTFTSLRALPPGIYETSNWLSFLPHFG